MTQLAASSAPKLREHVIHVIQGEFSVVSDPDIVLTTILGSCVAACIWDASAGVGGMNHFLLPGDSDSGDSMKFGVNSMELLINGLLQKGAVRSRLQAKLFGGAQVVANLSDVGAKNGEFAEHFLRCEGIPCVAQSLGGDRARRIRFWPTTGRAGQMLLDPTHADAVKVRAQPRTQAPAPAPEAGSVELW